MWRVVKETGSGLPIPGVNIQVKIQLKGPQPITTVVFSSKVSSGATLVFTYLGYKI
jgi:hypothetical protein